MKSKIVLSFVVHGVAQPAGSKRAFVPTDRDGNAIKKNGRIIVNIVDDNPKSKGWKKEVASAALRAWWGKSKLDGPLFLNVIIVRDRPKNHFGSGRNADVIKPSADSLPITKPDATKLLRGIEDACTGVLWIDDAQIVGQQVWKFYGSPPRVEIQVGVLPRTYEEMNLAKQGVLI